MLVDLVQTTTSDGLRLDGAYQAPSGPGPAPLGLDAFCFIHGTGGNFYSSTLFDSFADRLLKLGCGVLRVNTRGHDGISTAATGRGGRRLGAAYEAVDDCRQDLAAWIQWLTQNAGPRVGLLAHSLGAVKAIYALSRTPQPAVGCLVALSPPRLSYSVFCQSPQGPAFLETYQSAERLIQDGRPEALLEVQLPLPYVVTAAGFVEKYGPDERFNFLQFVASVPCPTLITFGSLETESNMAFQGVPDALALLAVRHRNLQVEIIAAGDHFYSGVRQEVVSRVEGWLQSKALI